MSVFACLCFNVTFAGGWTVVASTPDAKIANPDWVPPMPTTTSYVFSETGVRAVLSQTSTLLQVNCNSSAILQALGFGSSTKKLFSLGLEENGYEYNFDIKNCSLRGNKVNPNSAGMKSLTEKQALAFADTFMQNGYLKDKAYYQIGKPFVLYRNSNGPIYPMMKDSSSSSAVSSSDIEIDPNDTGADIVPEYTSFSVLYPYLINGQEVRDQYGNRIWIQLEVSADGVMSINARLLVFKWAKRNSEKLSGDDAVRILKNWGNSPFYAQTSTPVKFTAPQRVFILFSLWRDNQNYNYLSSGIGLKSNIKVDQYAQQPYSMILSDYKIGNTVQ